MELKEHVAEIVAAYLRNNRVSPDQLTQTITAVYEALARLGQVSEPVAALEPAVPIRRSVGADWIVCLECGRQAKMIRRHLTSAHGMTPHEYRAKWGLAPDYPIVAPNYAAQRAEFARSIGLGRKGRGSLAEEAPPSVETPEITASS